MKTLKDVKVGETVTVAKLHGEGPVKRRIMDMGITKGVEIYVRKVAPFGRPHGADRAQLRAERAQGRCRNDRSSLIPKGGKEHAMSIKIALAGNPNCGKTTLFNNLTGSNQYVGNWPGVTVEKRRKAS